MPTDGITLILSEQRNKRPDQELSQKGNNQCFWNLALILSFRLGLLFFKSEESAAPTSEPSSTLFRALSLAASRLADSVLLRGASAFLTDCLPVVYHQHGFI
jgi:hypothetical protein